jgi:hypothetical protein
MHALAHAARRAAAATTDQLRGVALAAVATLTVALQLAWGALLLWLALLVL